MKIFKKLYDKMFNVAFAWGFNNGKRKTGIFKIRDKEYNVKPGEMFVIPPYIETYYEADSVNPWSYIWIGFTTTREVTENLLDVIKCPEAEKIFSSMKNCESFSNGRSAYLSARLWDLFALLSEQGNIKYGYVEKALEFVHSNYMHDITVEKIARYLNLDRTYFSVIFKSYFIIILIIVKTV